jgi:hypothetical protein
MRPTRTQTKATSSALSPHHIPTNLVITAVLFLVLLFLYDNRAPNQLEVDARKRAAGGTVRRKTAKKSNQAGYLA